MLITWFHWGSKRHEQAPAVTESTRRFQFFGGRRYHAQAPYLLPTDDREINRLDFQHYMLRFVMKGNFAAPLRQPRDILDIGSGSGRWPLAEWAHLTRDDIARTSDATVDAMRRAIVPE
jgi:hypothetical protein